MKLEDTISALDKVIDSASESLGLINSIYTNKAKAIKRLKEMLKWSDRLGNDERLEIEKIILILLQGDE